MKILVITAMFPPMQTGTSFYSRNMVNELFAAGHDVVVATVSINDNNCESYLYDVNRIPSIHLSVRNYFKHLRFSSFFPQNYFKLIRLIREKEADVVLLVNHYLDIAFPAVVASRVCNIPLICSVGTQLQSCNRVRNKILRLLDRLICGNLVFPFCNKIVAWDTEIVRYIRDVQGSRFDSKIEIVNYGVNGDVEVFLAHTHDYRRHNQILGVGAVCEQRSFIPLVEAFAQVAPHYLELKLKIIGHVYNDAAVKKASELGISDRVEFTGELPHHVVLEEMKKSDAYFVSLTATYVGLGTASIETMLMGIPVIANIPADLLGKATLQDMEDIVLCHGLPPAGIAQKICMLMDSDALRENIGKNGRRFVQQHLNWSKVAADMTVVLQKTASDNYKRVME